ncbi:hypothetical protein [Streptomyces alanosinicus]|uniref:Integral membrane protein n=1 Tax=Streptomyces alanosinicus TaxID=68171 RepID=A0A918YTK6_9ACTN|nr:hypothetical protein [Streptomyces alanosinicus]GHE14971.1 hypothetical protein GCM10010339_88060 [Streptomyces alanosinicus]
MASGAASGPSRPDPSGESGHVLSAEEHAEYERLRTASQTRRRRLRCVAASVLLVLTLVLAPLAAVAVWVHDTVTDTGRYVQTVAPLASAPAVQNALVNRLTDRVVAQVDVPSVTASVTKLLADNGAPPRVVDASKALTGPLRSAVQTVVHRTIDRVVTSDAFQQAWVASNRRAQSAVVGMLTGEGQGALKAEGDTVQLDIGVVVDQVQKRLVDAGFKQASAIPQIDRSVTLFRTDELHKAQNAMRLLDIAGTWLPVLTLAAAAAAVWAAPAHRVMLIVTSLGVGAMMIVLLVALAVVRRVYLDSVPPTTLPPDAASVIFDTFVRFLRDSARTLIVVSVITALAAYLYGPSRAARAVRSTAQRGATAAGRGLIRAGVDTGHGGQWLAAHRSWTTGVTIGAGALALVLWNHPTVGVVALVLLLVVVVLAVTGVLAAATGPTATVGRADASTP